MICEDIGESEFQVYREMLVKVNLRSRQWDAGENESQVWNEIDYYETRVKIPSKSWDSGECES